jgi:hypothetical protein
VQTVLLYHFLVHLTALQNSLPFLSWEFVVINGVRSDAVVGSLVDHIDYGDIGSEVQRFRSPILSEKFHWDVLNRLPVEVAVLKLLIGKYVSLVHVYDGVYVCDVVVDLWEPTCHKNIGELFQAIS